MRVALSSLLVVAVALFSVLEDHGTDAVCCRPKKHGWFLIWWYCGDGKGVFFSSCCGNGECNIFCCNCEDGCRNSHHFSPFERGALVEPEESDIERTADVFNSLDVNGDGKLTEDEFVKYLGFRALVNRDQLASLDGDGDGSVSPQEFDRDLDSETVAKFKAVLEKEGLAAVDANGDGVISPEEFDSDLTRDAVARFR